jgi:hypothetical protein
MNTEQQTTQNKQHRYTQDNGTWFITRYNQQLVPPTLSFFFGSYTVILPLYSPVSTRPGSGGEKNGNLAHFLDADTKFLTF